MFSSTILDVAVGIIFTFLTVSLICGLLTETWATIRSWRAKTLLAGVQQLVNDPNFTGLAKALYQHALVSPRDSGTAQKPDQLKNRPSYIDPFHFADAMLDNLKVAAGTADQMKQAIKSSDLVKGDNQMTTMLTGMADRAGGDLTKLRSSIAAWFDAGMDRVSGTYKRWTQLFCFMIGLAIAIALNVDTLQVAAALWQQPQITHAIQTTMAPTDAFKGMIALDLPIGWHTGDLRPRAGVIGWLGRILGWTITGLSTLFGATFWFDALSGLLKLRGSGPSPSTTT